MGEVRSRTHCDQVLDDGLAARRDELRAPDRKADGNHDQASATTQLVTMLLVTGSGPMLNIGIAAVSSPAALRGKRRQPG